MIDDNDSVDDRLLMIIESIYAVDVDRYVVVRWWWIDDDVDRDEWVVDDPVFDRDVDNTVDNRCVVDRDDPDRVVVVVVWYIWLWWLSCWWYRR